MEEKEKENQGMGCIIAVFIILGFIFVPIVIGMISDTIKDSKETKHVASLVEAGKTKSSEDIINEIIEKLKNKENRNLISYLAEECIYYDNDNYEHKYISSFYDDLQILSSSYDIERRGDTSIDDRVTYRIYWNVVEKNKDLGRTSQYYCLQKITIMLKKVVKKDIITYEVEKIILTDN